MSTIERIISDRSRKAKRARIHKRLRLRCLRHTLSEAQIQHLEEQAELEQAMSQYENGLEIA